MIRINKKIYRKFFDHISGPIQIIQARNRKYAGRKVINVVLIPLRNGWWTILGTLDPQQGLPCSWRSSDLVWTHTGSEGRWFLADTDDEKILKRFKYANRIKHESLKVSCPHCNSLAGVACYTARSRTVSREGVPHKRRLIAYKKTFENGQLLRYQSCQWYRKKRQEQHIAWMRGANYWLSTDEIKAFPQNFTLSSECTIKTGAFRGLSYADSEEMIQSDLHSSLINSAMYRAHRLGMRTYKGGIGRRGIYGFADGLLVWGNAACMIEAIVSPLHFKPERKRLLDRLDCRLIFVIDYDSACATATCACGLCKDYNMKYCTSCGHDVVLIKPVISQFVPHDVVLVRKKINRTIFTNGGIEFFSLKINLQKKWKLEPCLT